MKGIRNAIITSSLAVAGIISGLAASPAQAYDGSETGVSTGIWAPMLPEFVGGPISDDQDAAGVIVGLYNRYRFHGYRTSLESAINYGETGDISMIAGDIILRDQWNKRFGGFSAGLGISAMHFDQDLTFPGINANIESNLLGGKIVAGWEGTVLHKPTFLDLHVGLYDLDGRYGGGGPPPPPPGPRTVSEFTTTVGLDLRWRTNCCNLPVNPSLGIEYFSDMPQWVNGGLTTDSALILTGKLEFVLW